MTLDELIFQATRLRELFGGGVRIGCWTYSGEPIHDGLFKEVTLEPQIDINVIKRQATRDGVDRSETKTETVVMLDHR